MSIDSTVTPNQVDQLAIAESYLFDRSPGALRLRNDRSFEVIEYLGLIPDILGRYAEDYQTDPNYAAVVLLPATADMYNRGVIDPFDENEIEFNRETDIQNKLLLNKLNKDIDNPEELENAFMSIGFIAFKNVIVRPEGLIVPKVDTLHSSHLGEMSSHQYAQNFRYAYNLLSKIGERTTVKFTRGLPARRFVMPETNAFDIDRMVDYVRNSGSKVDIAVVKVLNDIFIGSFSRAMLPLLNCDVEVASEIKNRFIERSLKALEQDPRYANVVDPFMKTVVTDDVAAHVIKGDKRGGGHHLPSLDSRYCRVIGPVEYITSELFEGRTVQVPIARMQKLDGKGNIVSDNVTTFFPSEWTAYEVLDHIKNPSRIRYVKEEDNGDVITVVYSAGLLIKRVSYEIDNEDDVHKLVTAFPAVSIPVDMVKRLKGN